MKNSGNDPAGSRIVLDTSAYAHLRRGHTAAVETVSEADVVLMPVTVLGELEAGFQIGARYRENRRALLEFLNQPFVATVDVTPETARLYGEVFADLRRAGTPIPVNDIWIAAATLSCAGHLVTFDRDFTKIERLPCTLL